MAPIIVGLVLLGLVLSAWDATHHDHGGPHGQPLTALEVKGEMTGQMFVTETGGREWVESAHCTGDSGGAARHAHFQCQLVFDNGETDDVLVHVQPDGLFFKSAFAGGT